MSPKLQGKQTKMITSLGQNGTTSVRTAIASSRLMQQLVAALPDKDKASTVEFLEAVLTDMDGITEKLRAAIHATPTMETANNKKD